MSRCDPDMDKRQAQIGNIGEQVEPFTLRGKVLRRAEECRLDFFGAQAGDPFRGAADHD